MNEQFEWEGPGYYASRQTGSHERQHIKTVKVGDLDEDYDEVSDRSWKSGYGTIYELMSKPITQEG
jgi:hypothetical protein